MKSFSTNFSFEFNILYFNHFYFAKKFWTCLERGRDCKYCCYRLFLSFAWLSILTLFNQTLKLFSVTKSFHLSPVNIKLLNWGARELQEVRLNQTQPSRVGCFIIITLAANYQNGLLLTSQTG